MMGTGRNQKTLAVACAIVVCVIMNALPATAEAESADDRVVRIQGLTKAAEDADATLREARDTVRTKIGERNAARVAFEADRSNANRDALRDAVRALQEAQRAVQEARIDCQQARARLNRAMCEDGRCPRGQRRAAPDPDPEPEPEPDPEEEICDNGEDDDGDGDVDCDDSDCEDLREFCEQDEDDDDHPCGPAYFHCWFWPTLVGLAAGGTGIGVASRRREVHVGN